MPTARQRRRWVITSLLHSSWACVFIVLDGEARPASASSRLLIFSLTGTGCCRHPGGCTVLSARGRTLGTGAGFLTFYGRVDELVDVSRHAAQLVSIQSFQLVCCRLGGMQVLEWRGVNWAVSTQHAGDG